MTHQEIMTRLNYKIKDMKHEQTKTQTNVTGGLVNYVSGQ